MKNAIPSGGGQFPWLVVPPAATLIFLFGLPLLRGFAVRFASQGTYGGIESTFTFGNYTSIADPLYLRIFWRSLWLAVLTTVICLVMGFPLAYVIARAPKRWHGILLFLVIIPFWTNFLVRTYAWMFILRSEGLLSTILSALGLTREPLTLLFTDTAVLIGLVYGYLPFMVLPLYAALERLDPSLIEAAWDLYARPHQVFVRVVLPLSKPGVIAGCVLVFIPSLGAYVTPDLLGGARSMMIGNLIQHQYLVVRDWPFGSALSFVLMAGVLAALLYYLRAGGARDL